MELSNWVEPRGSGHVAENVRGALDTIDCNEAFIKLTLAVLMTPDRQRMSTTFFRTHLTSVAVLT